MVSLRMRLCSSQCVLILAIHCIIVAAQGPGPGRKRSPSIVTDNNPTQMQSRAVDTRVQLEILEGQPRGALVGFIPTKPGFTYRFNESPRQFTMNGSTGEIRTTVILDREMLKTDRFDLVVLSSQPTYPIEVRIIVLDVNDNAPEFPEPSISILFSESAVAGTKLLLDTATDKDTGINGVSDDYRIIAGNTDDKFRLEVVATPLGDTSYLYLQTTGKLDRETVSFYQLNISARDDGEPIHYGYLQVNVTILDVNDNPPVFAQSDYSISLNESSPIGSKVLQVSATDMDEGNNAKISYYLSDSERRFSVDSESGEIFTAEILDCPHQNCQHQPKSRKACPKSCVFTVYVRDHGSPQQDGRAYVTVNLLDANDHDPVIKFNYFPSTAPFATVDENAMNSSVVAAVSVVDPDEGLNGETKVEIRSGNELNHFRMESGSSFDIVRVNGVLDREHINKYNLTIIASDKGTPSRTSTAYLIIQVNDVNDHEPVFEKSEYSAIISELSPIGTYVASITATDEDSGVNALIHYSIVSGNENYWFDINTDTGLVVTKSNLDREKQGAIELKISARDGGPNPKWTYTHLKVVISDENDEIPTFSQNVINITLPENVAQDTIIATLTATDHDQGTNGSVTYLLHPETVRKYPGVFSVDSLTGQLSVVRKLDREKISEYSLKAIAKDQGSPAQSSTAIISIKLQDVNDNDPLLYPTYYFVYIEEPSTDFPFIQITATDDDAGDNSKIRYKIETGDDIFRIHETSGIISLKGSISTLSKMFYQLRISATDYGGRKASEFAVVEIIRNGNNDLAFENNYIFQVKEDDGMSDAFLSRELGKVQIKTTNSKRYGNVKYVIVHGDPTGCFEINSLTGVLKTKNKIDRERQSFYSLLVIAKDGYMIGKTFVNITVVDINDNKPFFSTDKEEIKIPENVAVGQEIFLARAKDLDSGVNSRVSYSLTSDAENQFRISENTGVIYLNKPLRKEPNTIMNIEVKASDSGEPVLSSKQIISITISDVNDHTPVFDQISYETSLSELTPVNERFFIIKAVDEDFGTNGTVSYEIVQGNSEEKFGIFPDGYMYVKRQLDREKEDYYCLTVVARDGGKPQRSSTAPIIIHIIDENDNKPEFVNTTFSFHVKENEPIGTFVGKIAAIDKDIERNAELTYALLNTKFDFSIDLKNGFIRTLRSFDREELVQVTGQNFITLEAIVSDSGYPRLKDKVKVNVFITDVNDNEPQFLRLPYKVSISESSPIGTQVIRVFTTDIDEGLNKDVFYFISKGNDEKRFQMDEATGQITISRMLDRETTPYYELIVTAHDAAVGKSLTSTTTVTIEVMDENDNAPVFIQSQTNITVMEDTPLNTKLFQFFAFDSDVGENSEVVFSISSGNRRDAFQIDSLTGILYLHKKLDYEDITSYSLNITAHDHGNIPLATSFIFLISVQDCNDNPPSFPTTAIVRQIRENIPINTPIVTITAEDPDSGVNGKIIYSIEKQEPEDKLNPSNFHFQINPKTGVIHTQRPIDRELVDTFRLTIVATDQAIIESNRLYAEKLVTIIVEDLNDNAPVFVSMNAAVLPQSKPNIYHSFDDNNYVMSVLARDLDSGTNGLVTYDFIGSNTDIFHLHRSSGVITLKKHIPDIRVKYQLSIKATDEAVQSERKSSDSYVTIITPSKTSELIFENDFYSASIFENEPIGSNVIKLVANHKTKSYYHIEYYITNITGSTGQIEDRVFDVDTKSGIISTAVVLDREASSSVYQLEVYAIVVNGDQPITAFTKVRVDILDRNDSPPSFDDLPLEYSVSEDLPIGHVVTTIRATDPDIKPRITYSLIAGDIDKFNLDADTGVLTLMDSLDRETKLKYAIQIQANDGVHSADVVITLNVLDTNDNAPVFSEAVYSFDIAENSARGTKIGQVEAEDADEGINGLVTYTVISDWANDVFALNAQTGIFTLTAKLDYEEVAHYVFVVQAQDAGKPGLSSTVTVYFNVLDLNDNVPVFETSSYNAELFENATIATTALVVTATDVDSGDNGRLEYELIGDGNEDFTIDRKNGTIRSRGQLDRETKSAYNFIVIVKDKPKAPQKQLTASSQITITIKDVNDMSPEFITPNETFVLENATSSTIVTTVKAIDKDEGRNSYLEYHLLNSADGLFTLGLTDGLLRLNGKLDRELKSNYTIKVRAKDKGEIPRQTEMDMIIKVQDVNDNNPVFNPKQYSAFIPENITIGVTVLQVFATDDDEGINGKIRYSIISGDENRDFIISEDNGILRVAKNLNYERKSRYLLAIKAEDGEGNSDFISRYDTAVISISISDINDNFPTFVHSPYYAYVMENSIPNPSGYVVTVKAYDADSSPFNSQVRYFLKDGDMELFRINASSGDIYLLRPLDREIQSEHVLTVVAMDAGSPPLTGSGTVYVIVQDVNDHSPSFERANYVAYVSENLQHGTEVIHIRATDEDSDLNSKIRYSVIGENVNRFSVNSDTGLITTKVSLDREDITTYQLTVVAQDGSLTEPRASTVNLTIDVLDENDNAPIFPEKQYTIHVPDRIPFGQFIFGASATDADIGRNSQITYSIEGNSTNKFMFDEKTGVIRAKDDLRMNDLNGNVFKVKIWAMDQGNPPKKTYTDISIKLWPAHLFPFIITPKETSFTLPENIETGKLVTKLKASSPKSGSASMIRFAIAGGNINDAFKVDAITGEVMVSNGGLDYEETSQYEIWIEAQDSDIVPLRSVIKLTINVTDTNDNAPVLSDYNASVIEEEYPPLSVITVKSLDIDSGINSQVSYELSKDGDGMFTIDEETGEIFTANKLDREEISSYQLEVKVTDHGTPSLTGTGIITVTVLDKNDNPPRFTRLFSVNVTENAEPGEFVIRITSSDLDIAENANATYSLTENPGQKFAIDAISGNVTVIGPLDRELQDEYLLKVIAVDGSWRAETPLTITIQDENDNAPEFDELSHNLYFPESQSSSVFVGQIVAQDKDKPGPNSLITFSLKQPSDLFSIDPTTGEIYTKKSLKYSISDSSPENQFSLTVIASDNGKPPLSSECPITINIINSNNHSPKFQKNHYFFPVPFDGIAGQRLFQIQATDDLDSGINSEMEYFKINGNDSELFTINRVSGWISLTRPLKGVKDMTKYVITGKVIDHGIPSKMDETQITLIICGENHHSPMFSALSYQVIVPENEPIGTTILTVIATDNDEGPNGLIEFSINCTNYDNDKFKINKTSGAVFITNSLDFDTINEYRLNITATDLGYHSKKNTATLTILLTDINDNPPIFNQTVYDAFVSENEPLDTFVYQVKATDLDSPKYSIIHYSIIGGSGKEFFKIDLKTGEIFTKIQFDYEDKNFYTLDIVATNPDSSMYASTMINIHVTGKNEYYPSFVQPVFHFDISESSSIGTNVGQVQATDQDEGDDGRIYFLFVGSSNDRGFQINTETGTIVVSRHLDRETQNRVVLTVMAKNAGSIRGNDTDEAQVIISIQDGNDPPEFAENTYEAEISENSQIGTKVITVHAYDKDVKPQHNQFSYSIINGNAGKAFKIDPQNGDISTYTLLDRETVATYNLVVAAIDTGSPPETGTTTVKITLTDVNDNAPYFENSATFGYVMENEASGTSVMTLYAKDTDLPPNGGPFTYNMVGSTYKHLVSLDSKTGVIKTLQPIDRESTPQLDLKISVEDNGSPKMKATHSITVFILDQNDSPSYARSVHVLVYSFNEIFPIGKIGDIRPNDPDVVGDYKCKLLNDASAIPKSIFTLPKSCELHTSKIVLGTGFALSVSGNDGKHSDVISTVTIEFLSFDNITVENSITIVIENMTSGKFLKEHYKGFLEIVKNSFNSGDVILLYAMYDTDEFLQITLAVKDGGGDSYRNKEYVKQRILKRHSNLKEQLLPNSIIIGYSPCKNNTCENGGHCNEEIVFSNETKIIDSENLIFTSPTTKHEFTCICPDGYVGSKCERRQDPCSPNPCEAGGTCRRHGSDFQCLCPPSREGQLCQLERGEKCDSNSCQNGGSCRESIDGSGYFCLCRPGYKGNKCETIADSCRPNPCLNGGFCVNLKPTYKCNCPDGLHGQHCEKSTHGFRDMSYMTFSSLESNTNDISITFATTKPNALLIYNYGTQTGGRSDFVALELVNGKAIFSYGGTRTAIATVSVPKGIDRSICDGKWHKITATRNGRLVSLSVSNCTDNGDHCDECRPGESSCYVDDNGPAGTLNFNKNPLYIGGLESADAILERPGQVHSDDFVGCMHSVLVNGRQLNLSGPIKSHGVEPSCNRATKNVCSAKTETNCAICDDQWSRMACTCGDSGLTSYNCDALDPITLTDGAFIRFKISEKYRRVQLLDSIYSGSTLWHRSSPIRLRRDISESHMEPIRHMSFVFRTVKSNGLLFYSATNTDYSLIEIVNNEIVYRSRVGTGSAVNMTADTNSILSDGQWHNVTLLSRDRVLWIYLDGEKAGEELDSESVHNFLDPYLTVFMLGGGDRTSNIEIVTQSFSGCLANLTINGEIQPFGGDGSIFSEVIQHGKISIGCSGPTITSAVTNPDPLRIGVSLVLVFFMILLVGISVSFVVFRIRKQKKEKDGINRNKQNGGPGNNGGAGGDVIRSGLHSETTVPPYMTDNGDLLRGIAAHHMMAPELISKRFKDQDMPSIEHMQRSQRPDIIEREVVGKSPLPREEHCPPRPPSNHHVHETSHSVADSDMPEHYDLENSSSIAPSDIDIIYHYKNNFNNLGYRDGGNLRKYKALPQHIPPPGSAMYHKQHATQHHRHSPHCSTGYPVPPRDSPHTVGRPPPPVTRVDSPKQLNLQHSTTPLARLSPSSELSQQMPRILTLQDISGKPLQSALLATTSSSGGVGKDALHTSSERSLNSPVMSQLSGQSSSESRKTGGPASQDNSGSNNGLGMRLTADEISRLNSHARNSSLVSTLDVVACSSGRVDNAASSVHHRHHGNVDVDDNNSSTSSDESGNDSFTCSEIEYDNNSVSGEKLTNVLFNNRSSNNDEDVHNRSSSRDSVNKLPSKYSNFDSSSFRGSLSTLVASDDDISHVPIYRPQNSSPTSIPTSLGWEYLLNWGPNFESLAGVFKDIAELPDTVNGRASGSFRVSNKNKTPEEYV